jgi:DNA-binding MurR/RpiR family transcriptional regulator
MAAVRGAAGRLISALRNWLQNSELDPYKNASRGILNALEQAHHIVCIGTGVQSNFLVQQLQARLFRDGFSATALSDPQYQLIAVTNLSSGSVLIVFSFAGQLPEALRAVKLAKKRGATVIAVTRCGTPLSLKSDIVLGIGDVQNSLRKIGWKSRSPNSSPSKR